MAISGLLLGALLLAPQSSDVKTIADECTKDTQARIQKREITSFEQYVQAMEPYAKRIDFKNLNREDFNFLLGHALSNSPIVRGGLKDRLPAFKPTGDIDAAALGSIKLLLNVPEPGANIAAKDAIGVLRMKGARGLLRDEANAEHLMNVMGSLNSGDKEAGKAYTMFFGLTDVDLKPAQALAVGNMWGAYAENFSKDKDFQLNWTKVNKVLSEVIAGMPKPEPGARPDRTAQLLNRAKTSMETAAGRGKLIGYEAPAINFMWSSDGAKTMADYKGKVVVVDFWATWCGPCIASMPKLRELTDAYAGKDVVVLGVTSIQGMIVENGKRTEVKDPQEEIRLLQGYQKSQNMNWVVACSEENVFHPGFGVQGIPYMAIIGRDGKVRHAGLHPGALTLDQKKKLIDPLLAESK